jgi:hypothetical protein
VLEGANSLDARLALLPRLIAVGEALAYAHARGVIHRDIKPGNILCGEFGETVLIDWGLAKRVDDTDSLRGGEPQLSSFQTAEGTVVGTPRYMSPEQAVGQPADERSDVYSLGVVLYEMLTGASPYADPVLGLVAIGFNELSRAIAEGRVVPAREHEPDAPRDLTAIAERALALDPAQRYPSAKAFVDDLQRFTTGQLISRRYTSGELARRWLRRRAGMVSLGGVALLALVTIGALSALRVSQASDAAQASLARLELDEGRLAYLGGDPLLSLAYLAAAIRDGADGPVARYLLARASEAVARPGAGPRRARRRRLHRPLPARRDHARHRRRGWGRALGRAFGSPPAPAERRQGRRAGRRVVSRRRAAGHRRARRRDPRLESRHRRLAGDARRPPRLHPGHPLLARRQDAGELGPLRQRAPVGPRGRAREGGVSGAHRARRRGRLRSVGHARAQRRARRHRPAVVARLRAPLCETELDTGSLVSADFAPDGARFAVGGDQSVVAVHEAATCRRLLRLRAAVAEISTVRFDPSGRRLLAAGLQATRLWDAQSGRAPADARRALGDADGGLLRRREPRRHRRPRSPGPPLQRRRRPAAGALRRPRGQHPRPVLVAPITGTSPRRAPTARCGSGTRRAT